MKSNYNDIDAKTKIKLVLVDIVYILIGIALIVLIFRLSGLSTVVFINNIIYKAGFTAGAGMAFIGYIILDILTHIVKSIKKCL